MKAMDGTDVFTASSKEIIDETLEWVNKFREAVGLEPLKRIKSGHKASSQDCPLARSLSNGIEVSVTGYEVVVDSPRSLARPLQRAGFKQIRTRRLYGGDSGYDRGFRFVHIIIPPAVWGEFVDRFDQGQRGFRQFVLRSVS